jgi:hypothetical protein
VVWRELQWISWFARSFVTMFHVACGAALIVYHLSASLLSHAMYSRRPHVHYTAKIPMVLSSKDLLHIVNLSQGRGVVSVSFI